MFTFSPASAMERFTRALPGNLTKRVFHHKGGVADGFTKKHRVHSLVYFEVFGDIREAIKREKTLKRWRRAWKLALIESVNRAWEDLAEQGKNLGPG
jgi:putative endonuclease